MMVRKLVGTTVISGFDLIGGNSCNKERLEQFLVAGWANDPAHPNGQVYAKMALNVIEKISTVEEPTSRKRPRSSF